MKNIVKVLRYKDNAARLYALPDGVTVKAGTMVRVEFPNMFNTCDGVTVSDSYPVDAISARMVAKFHRINPPTLDGLKKVVSIYTENPVDWPVDDPDAEDDVEADDEEPEDGEDE